MKMIATLPTVRQENGRMLDGEKEQIRCYKVIAYKTGGDHWSSRPHDRNFKEIITVRVWMGRSYSASVVYAACWINAGNNYSSGRGQAGGYGYCKKSAAIGAAFKSAGIKLNKDISGVGESAVRDALEAIARALGYSQFAIVEA